jgi:NADP-dependent 3-hydroxy acid dehydrogenase YdfG
MDRDIDELSPADVADVAGRFAEHLGDTAAKLRDAFDLSVVTAPTDVADAEAVETAVDGLGGLDVLLNVAGVSTH